jgi:hypothetical protein
MGHQIHAGESGIYTTDGSWMVVEWCERFTPSVKPDYMPEWLWHDQRMGSTDISAEAVKLAHQKIPFIYSEALDLGLVLTDRQRAYLDEDTFNECREFLRYAAGGGYAINGSY